MARMSAVRLISIIEVLLPFLASLALAQSPTISSIAPTSGVVGEAVQITGSGFGATQAGSTVTLNGTSATAISWSDTAITAIVPTGAGTGAFSVTVSGQIASSGAFSVTTLPSSWSDADVGTVGTAGSATYANGIFTVKGAGTQIYGTADSFNFAYQSMSGDGSILARVTSIQGGSSFASIGVMIRESLNSGSTNIKLADWPAYRNFYLDLRSSTNGSTSEPTSISAAPPYWIKVARSGSTFSAYGSTDGVNWAQVGASQTISMATTVDIGLAVTSGSTSSLTTVTFDNVSVNSSSNSSSVVTGVSATTGNVGDQIIISGTGFGSSESGSIVTLNATPLLINAWSDTSIAATISTGATSGPLIVSVASSMNDSNPTTFTVTSQPLPSGWLDADVGSVGTAGSATYGSGTFTVKGAGSQIYGTADSFHFAYQPVSGDGTIIARVASIQGGSSFAAIGGMIRETLLSSSTNIKLADWPTYHYFYLDLRSTSGASTAEPSQISGTPPYWVKLVRSGSTFSVYGSTNGSSWTQVGSSQTISMAANIDVGLCVTSGSTSALATATFDNVSSSFAGQTVAPSITAVSPSTAVPETSVTITGSNFGSAQGASTLTFNGTTATPIAWSGTTITVPVPLNATSGNIVVTVGGVASNGVPFTVSQTPTINSLSPAAGPAGTSVTISGVNFGSSQGSSRVTFNGIAATPTNWSSTSITAPVPSGATTGNVVVTTTNGSSSGTPFTVYQVPNITSLSASSTTIGALLVITGTNFGATQGSSTVTFSGVAGLPTSWSASSIAVPVPVGATTGNVVVTVNGLSSNAVSLTVVMVSLPSVAQVFPANAATAVPENSRVIVRFTQAVQAAAVIPDTISVSQGGTNTGGNLTLSNDGLSVTFVPSQNLASNTTFGIRVTDLAGNQTTPEFQSTFTTGSTTDTVAPTVVQTNPQNNSSGAPTSVPIRARFSKVMDPGTITAQTFSVADTVTGQTVPGAIQVDASGMTGSFIPQAPLAVGRTFSVTLTSAIQDAAGNGLTGSPSFRFTTSYAPDLTAPQITGLSPQNGTTGIPLNVVIVAAFSKPLDATSVSAGMQVEASGQPIPGATALSNGNQTVTFTPTGGLTANTTYTVVANAQITDVGGLALSNPQTFSFTTGSANDSTTPAVSSVAPANYASGIPINGIIQLQFSKPIDPLTVTTSTFQVSTHVTGVQVPQAGTISVSADGQRATFVPSGSLSPYTSYSVQPTNGIADLEGHGLAYFSSTFTTGASSESLSPTVIMVSPANGTLDVPVNARIDAAVSSVLYPPSVNNNAVALSVNGSGVAGNVTLSSDGTVLTFLPASPLSASMTYTITVSGATDQAGNPITTFTSSFTTAASSSANTTQPSVLSSDPANGATSVAVTVPITLTFNEPIDMTTVSDSSVPISVSGTSGVLSGTYSVDATGAVLTFTPLSPLPPNATIVVKVNSNGVLDLSGNGSTSYSGTFTTGTGSDTTAPTVQAVTPTNDASGISLNSPIVLTFSKSINPSTINTDNFGILVNGSSSPNGLGISTSSDNRVVTLNPYGLPPLSTITVVVTNGVTDLYGNPLSDFESQFATGAASSVTPPTVVSQRPGMGATAVPVNDSIVLYLSQPMNQASLTGALYVSQNGTIVNGTTQVTDNGQVIQFTPSAAFQPNAFVQIFLSSSAQSLTGVNMNNYQSSFTTIPDISTTTPAQTSSNPAPSVISVPTNVAIDLSFNVPLDPNSLTATSVLCYQNGVWVQGNVSLIDGGTILQILPRSTLQPNTLVSCRTDGTLQGTNGLTLPASNSIFTTGSGPDTVVPTIVSISPSNGLTNVGDNAIVRLIFSKPVNPLTVNANTVQLSGGGVTLVPDSISFSNSNQIVLLVPHSPLPDSTQMTLSVSGVTDVAGNPIQSQTVQFTTGIGPDTVPPLVVWTNPLQTGLYLPPSNIPLNGIVQVQANEAIDPGTVNVSTFPVLDGATNLSVSGTYSVSPDGLTATFVPSAPFAANHSYSVYSMNGGMTDLAGNSLTSAVSGVMGNFSFITGTTSNTDSPQVTGVSPATSATGIPINARATVSFNEPVDVTKLTGLTLTGPTGVVSASPSVTNGNQTIALIPVSPLASNTQYTINVAGIQDFSGNILASPVTSTFTTGSTSDLKTPKVASTIPTSSATSVSTTSPIQVHFSKAINPLTITSTTFYLYPYATNIPVSGTISISSDGQTATLTPSGPLDSLTFYVMQLTSAITDLEGHSLGANNSFTFTTGQGTTEPPPAIGAISPSLNPVGSTVRINGSYFGTSQASSTVNFNGVEASVTSWGDAQIVTTVPSGATTGNVVVTVNGVASNGQLFTVQVTPSITDVSPSSATVGTVLTITGSNFGDSQDATNVTFSTNTPPFYQAVTPSSWTETSITVTVPSIAATGNVYVVVGNTGSNTLPFTVIPTPNVSSLSTNSGVGGTQVIINGSNFGNSQGSSSVKFNGVAAAVSNWTNSSITTTAPSNVTTGPVTVVENSVTSNSNVIFTVTNPAIGTLSPPSGAIGATVTLTGSGLAAPGVTTQVFFSGIAANVSTASSTNVTVQVPTNATSGPVTVEVGGIPSNSLDFTIEQPPSIGSLSSNQGPFMPDGSIGTLTITGSGFGATQSNSTVAFWESNTAPNVVSWSDTSITVSIPNDASTGPLTVTVGGINVATATPFAINQISNLTDSQGNKSTYIFEVQGGQWATLSSAGTGCSTCSVRGDYTNVPDGYGNTQTSTDGLGNTATYTYDGNNNVTSISKPLTQTATAKTSYTYNGFNEVLTMTDPLGNVTTNAYDSHGNLTSVTTPKPNANTSASVTQFQYDTKGELTQITDPNNHITKLTYNSVGLIATITDAQNNVTSYQYDTRGNRTAVIDPINGAAHPTSFAYDIMNRLTGITYPDGSTVGFGYDTRGRRTSVTDQNNKTTTYTYDDADRLTSVTDPANHVTQYAYDTEDNLLSITDANNHTTQFAYNALGWVTQTTFPSTLQESYTYDAVGNLLSKTDRKGNTIQYVYDALYRLQSKAYPDQTSVEYTYDLAGKVLQVGDPTGSYGFAYDNMGRLIGTTTQYAWLPTLNFQNTYTYDAASNRTSLTGPDSSVTTYGYDTLNRLNGLANSWAGSFGFGYDALSRRTSLTRPNGVNTTYGYDSVSHLLSVLHQTATNTLDGAGYTYDPAGNRMSKTNYLNGVTSNYGYDPLYQLTQVTQGGSTTESYSYDAVGNRLSSLGVPNYNYNASNELTSNSSGSYTYDANGNTLTDASGKSYTWDFENRLTQAVVPGTNGGTTTFRYDPFGRRIQKSGPLGTTNYLYDKFNSIEEVDNAGNVLAKYTHGTLVDEDLAMLRNGSASYYHQDGLGSITSLSNGAGVLVQTYAYDNFGKLTASTGTLTNPFQYTGREFDSETGVYYYRARYFDSSAGRFLSQDPIRFRGGVNFYAYTRNNPVVLKDAWGFQGCPAQSPNCVPTDPNSPYQGSEGLWYNVPDWYPDMVGTLLPEPPANDDDVLNPGNCECNLTKLLDWANKVLDEADDEDERTVGFAWGTFFTLQGVEKALEHIGAEGAAEWIPGVDVALLGHDYYEIWDHHNQAEEIIRMRFKECGDDW